MLNVSAKWQEASAAQFRYQAYLECAIRVTPPDLREGAAYEFSEIFDQCDTQQFMDDVEELTPYATLEHNLWALNGEHILLDQTDAIHSWWSKDLVDTNNPTVHFEFDKPYTIPGVFFKWDLVHGTFPASVTITGYDVYGSVISSVTITDINSATGYVECPFDNVVDVDIAITEWSVSSWRSRLNYVLLGFDASFTSENNGRIAEANVLDSVNLLNASLPSHTASVKLRNYDLFLDPTRESGIAKYLDTRQVMTIRWGFRTDVDTLEWSPSMTYLIDSAEVSSEDRYATITGSSRLDLLKSTFYMGTYTGTERTFKDIAQYVLENSNVLKTNASEQPWVLPSILEQYTTSAPIPALASNAVLQLIAGATNTLLSTNALNGYIAFKEIPANASQFCAITKDQSLGDPRVELAKPLRSVTVGIYTYKAESTTKSVGSFEGYLNGIVLVKVGYSVSFATGVSASITGATIQDAQYYASYALITVQASGNKVTIELTGTEVVQTVAYLEAYRDPNVPNGNDIEVSNPLVTNLTTANLVAAATREYYRLRNVMDVDYLGYPQLEAGDKIHMESEYNNHDVVVEKNDIAFNGGWSGKAVML